jgi:lysozyme
MEGFNLIRDLLIKHEGLRLKPYIDTTGNLTIGYGRNLDGKGITKSEALSMLDNDIREVKATLKTVLPVYSELSDTRKAVLENMCFNIGITKLLKFKKMLTFLDNHDYKNVASEMLKSKWATQVHGRARELAKLMEGDL